MPTPKDGKLDPDKVEQANDANAKADDQAASEQDTDENHGKLVVLMRGFVARVDPKVASATRRYRLGDEFHPLDDIHDVDSLIAQKVIGRVGDGELRRTTALHQAQAQATLHDEESPVVDLDFQPFTQSAVHERPKNPGFAVTEVDRRGTQPEIDTDNAITTDDVK